MNELWPIHDRPLCARCNLELFADEWFICNQCRFEGEHERVLEFHEVCLRAAFNASQIGLRQPVWRIG